MEDKAAKKPRYQCVHCGTAVPELYRDFKKGIIKISHCGMCKEVADKYIEYDPVIIFLDTLLLQRSAYRHVLVNSGFQRKTTDVTSTRLQPNHVLYSALELAFYRDYLVSAAESLILFGIIMTLLFARHIIIFGKRHKFELEAILKAMIISSMGRLLVVPALVWGETYSSLGVVLTRLFTGASNVQVLRALRNTACVVPSILVEPHLLIAFSRVPNDQYSMASRRTLQTPAQAPRAQVKETFHIVTTVTSITCVVQSGLAEPQIR
ncbi:hypothetical protein BaRGS_00003214 [Batillaria attramentaria]|uniref:Protein ARV n=1 Tax=Batillaria attramentaria TaxID=370345 RepID=A0ABD0M180_9CAEN